jgi:hypothetical protein
MANRPFPPSRRSTNWTLFSRDHNGQKLAFVYFEDEPGRRSAASPISSTRANNPSTWQTSRAAHRVAGPEAEAPLRRQC